MKKLNYKQCIDAIDKDKLELIEEKFYELRERYLMYVATGVPHDNSVENALFDVFEGDNDIQEQYPEIENDQDVINLCMITLVFDNFEQLFFILEDETVQLNIKNED